MAGLDLSSPLTQSNMRAAVSNTFSATTAAVTSNLPADQSSAGGFIYALPHALLWIIGFCTITVPTWLFTLFSMSLTFTMNFTTL
jgi:lysophospholipid hydrolase